MRTFISRCLLAGATLLAAATAGLAAGVSLDRVAVGGKGVKEPGGPVTVAVKGTLQPPGILLSTETLEVQFGAWSESVAGSKFTARGGSRQIYRGARGTAGVASFDLNTKSGKFSLVVKDAAAGVLTGDVPISLVAGERRMTALLRFRGGGAPLWKSGDSLGGLVKGRVMRVSLQGGHPLLTPLPGADFTRGTPDAAGISVVGGDASTRTDVDGLFSVGIAYTDPAVLSRLDLSKVLGTRAGLTQAGEVRVTEGRDGELRVVGFVQDAAAAAEAPLDPASTTVLPVAGSGSLHGGTLSVPAGAVGAPVDSLRFLPYVMMAELPAPMPPGWVALAGAEVKASAPTSFAAAFAPRAELDRPRWVDRAVITGAALGLLQWKGGLWVEAPGKGRYDVPSDRIVPDPLEPAGLTDAAPFVYALKVPTRSFRGRVLGSGGLPVEGAAAFTRAGAAVTDEGGNFKVPGASLAVGALEVVQVVGSGSTTARVVEATGTTADSGSVPLDTGSQRPWEFGLIEGSVIDVSNGTPAGNAVITVRLNQSVKGMEHDDGGTPDNPADDVFRAADLSSLGVTAYEWALTFPEAGGEVVSTQTTGREAKPATLLLEAQGMGRTLVEGAYTVRVEYDVPGFGAYTVYGGFRMTFDVLDIAVSDIQLPAAFEGTSTVQVAADGNGRYSLLFRAPEGSPLEITADAGSGATTPILFNHAQQKTFDFLSGSAPGAPPALAGRPAPPPPAVLNAWRALAPMGLSRTSFGAGKISGKVFCFGGQSSVASYTVDQVLDLASKTWSPAPNLPEYRAHMAVGVVGQKLHVLGGVTVASQDVATDDILSFDETANSWTTESAVLSSRRFGAGAAVVAGKVYVVGGGSGTADATALDVFDPVAGTCVARASMSVSRKYPAVVAINGKIYVAGGVKYPYDAQAALEVYDPATNAWETKASLPTPVGSSAACAFGGRLYVFGGFSGSGGNPTDLVQIYDPATDTWEAGTPLPAAVYGARAVPLAVSILVIGGSDTTLVREYYAGPPPLKWTTGPSCTVDWANHGMAAVNGKLYVVGQASKTEVYDTVAGTWASKAPMNEPRQYLAVAAAGGKVYAMGGFTTFNNFRTTNEAYDPATDTWATKAALPVGLISPFAAGVGGKVYLFGGVPSTGGISGATYIYDPGTDVWSTGAPMPTARFVGVAGVIGGKIHLAGGAYSQTTLEIYDPASDSWTTGPSMGSPQQRGVGGAIGGYLYLVDGTDAAASAIKLTQVYDPASLAWSIGPANPGGWIYDVASAVWNGKLYVVHGTALDILGP